MIYLEKVEAIIVNIGVATAWMCASTLKFTQQPVLGSSNLVYGCIMGNSLAFR